MNEDYGDKGLVVLRLKLPSFFFFNNFGDKTFVGTSDRSLWISRRNSSAFSYQSRNECFRDLISLSFALQSGHFEFPTGGFGLRIPLLLSLEDVPFLKNYGGGQPVATQS